MVGFDVRPIRVHSQTCHSLQWTLWQTLPLSLNFFYSERGDIPTQHLTKVLKN